MVKFIFIHRGIDSDRDGSGEVLELHIFKVQIVSSQTDPHTLIGNTDTFRISGDIMDKDLFFLFVVKVSSGDLFDDLGEIHLLQQDL